MSTPRARRAETALIHQAAALLLSYPDDGVLASVPMIRTALAVTGTQELFEPVLSHLESLDLMALQAYHVQEFDLSRRHALHLSYWTAGDTRRRGEVLAGLKQVYRASGLLVHTGGELPDFLPMMLEFAAHDPERGVPVLAGYRPSLELLRFALADDHVPHTGVVEAVCGTLPGASPSSRDEVQAMVRAAQPSEEVGLEPYGAEPTVAFLGLPERRMSEPRRPELQRS